MQYRLANRNDLDHLRAIAADANESPYALSTVIEEKCFGSGVSAPPETILAFEGERPVGFVTRCQKSIRLIAVVRDDRHRGHGTTLLMESEVRAKRERTESLTVGCESGNYFVPGVPENAAMTRFFEQHGFVRIGETTNLAVELIGNDLIEGACDGVRRARSDERDEIVNFISLRFAKQWAFEVLPAFEADPAKMFVIDENDHYAGFAAYDVNNRGLGFFGPAGVVETERGRGTGRRLTRAALQALQQAGFERAVIPWVSSPEFYERVCGARLDARFHQFEKRLD